MNNIKDKITSFYWCFKPNLISRKRWLKAFLWDVICLIINYDLCVYHFLNALHTFSLSLENKKIDYCCQLDFPFTRYLKIICNIFKKWSTFIKIFLNWCSFIISISITLIFNYIFASKITRFHWFLIIFFFLLKRFLISLIIMFLVASF